MFELKNSGMDMVVLHDLYIESDVRCLGTD